jgi:hypothetical protein
MTVTIVTNRYRSRSVKRSCCRYRRYLSLWEVTLVTLTQCRRHLMGRNDQQELIEFHLKGQQN